MTRYAEGVVEWRLDWIAGRCWCERRIFSPRRCERPKAMPVPWRFVSFRSFMCLC